jgi:hypothetical protein
MLWLIPLRPVLLTQLAAITFTIIELTIGKVKFPSLKSPWWIIMSGLLFGVVFSHIGNFYILGATDAFTDFGKTYLTFILIWINLNSVKRIVIFNVLIVAIAFFIAVHCILIQQTGQGFGDIAFSVRSIGDNAAEDTGGVIQAKFYGIFNDPNDTAQFLVATIPLCIFIILRIQSVVLKIIPLSIIVALIWGTLATQSRGGFIAMAVTFFVFLRGYFRPAHFIAISVLGAALFPVLAPARLRGGLVDESSSSRLFFWAEGFDALKSNPLFGVGYRTIHDHTDSGHTVHNSYVQACTELGVFGFIFWFCTLIFAIYSMLKLSKALPENNEDKTLIIWMKCIAPGLAGSYAASFFLSRAYILPLYVLFALTAAVYSLASKSIGTETLNKYCHIDQKHWSLWIGLAWLSMAALYLVIRVLLLIT